MKHSDLPSKINDTGIRVLELLKYMINSDININENNCNIPKNAEIMPETYLKYFSTIESAGFPVIKKYKKYSLCSFPQKIKINDEDIHILKVLCDNFQFVCSEKETESFIKFAEKIKNSLENKQDFEKILNKFKEKTSNKSEIQKKTDYYENYLNCGQKLKITCKNETFTCEPKEIEITNGKIYFKVYDIKTMNFKKILSELISEIEILPIRATQTTMKQSAVFEVYNRLIDNYRLRDNERVESFSEKAKTIVATDYDKNELLKRLLKYGENCKIIRPKFLQKEFLAMVNDIKNKIEGTEK